MFTHENEVEENNIETPCGWMHMHNADFGIRHMWVGILKFTHRQESLGRSVFMPSPHVAPEELFSIRRMRA